MLREVFILLINWHIELNVHDVWYWGYLAGGIWHLVQKFKRDVVFQTVDKLSHMCKGRIAKTVREDPSFLE